MHRLRWRRVLRPLALCFPVVAAALAGCASPGPPRPPSLQLPALVSDLTATRSGSGVSLHFTVPLRTTDGLPLRGGMVTGGLCRQLAGAGPCTPVDVEETRTPIDITDRAGAGTPVTWTDPLPEALRSGAVRAIGYRVQLRNVGGRSAGYSEAVYAAAGEAPEPVRGFGASGTRLGTELHWQPSSAPGTVLVDRNGPPQAGDGSPKAETVTGKDPRNTRAAASEHPRKKAGPRDTAQAGTAVMEAATDEGGARDAMLDTTAAEGTPYVYVAVRRKEVQVGGRQLELSSEPSPPARFTWHDLYPPPTPQRLTALGYDVPAGVATEQTGSPAPPGYAVDLIWEPVNDARLAGYLVYRQKLDRAGKAEGERIRLTAQPVATPGFHDATARPGERYRYSVTAIDPKGNESGAAEATLQP